MTEHDKAHAGSAPFRPFLRRRASLPYCVRRVDGSLEIPPTSPSEWAKYPRLYPCGGMRHHRHHGQPYPLIATGDPFERARRPTRSDRCGSTDRLCGRPAACLGPVAHQRSDLGRESVRSTRPELGWSARIDAADARHRLLARPVHESPGPQL